MGSLSGGIIRWLVVATLLVATGARLENGRRSYPVQVHQMFLQQKNGHGHVGNGNGNGHSNGHGNGGVWAPWSPWTSCSRSCGGGVAAQTRECRSTEKRRRRLAESHLATNGLRNVTRQRHSRQLPPPPPTPPPHSSCVGVYKRFHICNDKPCPVGSKDFRLSQCEAFNYKPMAGHFYSWVPYLEAPNPCELNCRPAAGKFYARLNATVEDGTDCPPAAAMPPGPLAPRAICVTGLCKAVGCDGVVGSSRRPDACGVCGGNNSTCRLVSGLFTRPTLPRVGYHLIAQLPRGACNISVTELKHSRNFLALRRKDGSFVINGNWAISWSGEYEAAGTRITYRRQDAGHLETVTAPGPLIEPLDIMVIFQQPNPGIKYEYTLPMKMDGSNGGDALAHGVPGNHGAHGGLGAQPMVAPPLLVPQRQPSPAGPVRSGDTSVKDLLAADAADKRMELGIQGTESQPSPPQPQPRTRGRKRKFAWRTTGLTECSRSCGGGVQTPIIACVREHGLTPVPERRCSGLPRPPTPVLRCGHKPCPAQWAGGEWSACSVTCGSGLQARSLLCQQQVTPALTMTVATGACLDPEPSPDAVPRTRRCVMQPCDGPEPASAPAPGPAPALAPAITHWSAGPWSECSMTCGMGHRSRDVLCGGAGGGAPVVCPPDERPIDVEPCDKGPCPASSPAPAPAPRLDPRAAHTSVWIASEWTHQCSAACGTGVQARRVLCWPGPEEAACEAAARPTEARACASDKQCPGQWFAGPWGQCSARCGRGRQSRVLTCVAMQRGVLRIATDGNCAAVPRPEHERPCVGHDCGPDWFAAEWTPCSRECGGGVQKREVQCLDQHRSLSSACSEDRRPPAKRTCNSHECGSSPEVNGNGAMDNRLKDEPTPNRDAGDQASSKNDQTAGEEECLDRIPNCHLVVQARLCTLYQLYRKVCCLSCRKKL